MYFTIFVICILPYSSFVIQHIRHLYFTIFLISIFPLTLFWRYRFPCCSYNAAVAHIRGQLGQPARRRVPQSCDGFFWCRQQQDQQQWKGQASCFEFGWLRLACFASHWLAGLGWLHFGWTCSRRVACDFSMLRSDFRGENQKRIPGTWCDHLSIGHTGRPYAALPRLRASSRPRLWWRHYTSRRHTLPSPPDIAYAIHYSSRHDYLF